MNIGEKIKNIRKSLKISQAELGERIGVKQRTISAWESNQNEPPLDALLQILKLANVTPNYFFLDKDDKVDSLFLNAKNEAIKHNKLHELEKILEDFIINSQLSSISQKIRSLKGNTFIQKLGEAWHGKGHRTLIVLYYFIEHLQKKLNDYDTNISNKEKLIKELKSFKIPKKIRAKHLFAITQKDKENLISWVEKNLDDIDAASLLADLPKLKEIVKEEINYPNKALL